MIDRVRDAENFAFWHSATFNNAGTKVVFTDELGGGGGATCNEAIGPKRGADAIYDMETKKVDRPGKGKGAHHGKGKEKSYELVFASYYKIPRDNADTENCVAHNGSLIPVHGQDIMVQAWYQGGISVWDFTDSANPIEIAYWERGPLSDERLILRRFLVGVLLQRLHLLQRHPEGPGRAEAERQADQVRRAGQVQGAQRPVAGRLPELVILAIRHGS